jgi:hypothetical protein
MWSMEDRVDHYRLMVVELNDGAGPRRRPDRPNLYLGVTKGDPQERFERIQTASKRHQVIRDHGIRLRADLTRNYSPTTEADARRQKGKLAHKLMRQGFTVNGDTRVWRLYVIELDDGVGPRASARHPWVYVGETSIPIEERFEQHRLGVRNRRGPLFARAVRDHAVRLRPDLFEHEPLHFTAADSKVAEALLAARLEAAGFSVKGGH